MPLKIVHVITRLITGGADENTILSCNAQVAAGHEVWLVFGREHDPAMQASVDPRVRTLVFPVIVRRIDPISDVLATVRLVRLFRRLRPDIVHTHTSKAGILGRAAAFLAGVRGVVHGLHILPFMNEAPLQRWIYKLAEKVVAPATHAFVSVSDAMRHAALESGLGRPEQHFTIASGMALDRFTTAAPLSLTELEGAFGVALARPPRLVLAISALEKRKRIAELVRIIAGLGEGYSDVHLVVLGKGDQFDALSALTTQAGLQGRVHLLGFRGDVERWISTAEVCVICSLREGLPRAIVQYALGARPIICTELPGVDRVVRQGFNGYLVPPDRLDEMAPLLQTLLSDVALRHEMTANARSLDLSDWGVEKMTSALEVVYMDLLAKPRDFVRG
jgi:glycosyltransferase involved in cell wall biosynthesis